MVRLKDLPKTPGTDFPEKFKLPRNDRFSKGSGYSLRAQWQRLLCAWVPLCRCRRRATHNLPEKLVETKNAALLFTSYKDV